VIFVRSRELSERLVVILELVLGRTAGGSNGQSRPASGGSHRGPAACPTVAFTTLYWLKGVHGTDTGLLCRITYAIGGRV
jgi:hypothetical protein